MNPKPIKFERLLDAPVSKVWKALTDRNEMSGWYFDLADFKAEVGFRFRFSGGPSPEKQYVHLCEVTEVIPERKLTYGWRYEGYSGNSFVTFELVPDGKKTLLTLTHSGIETFPAENTDFDIKNFIEGWNHIVNISLRTYVEPREFQTDMTTNASPTKVFESLTTHIAKWWSAEFEGSSGQVGDHFTVRFGGTYKTFLVVSLIPAQKVVWRATDSFIDLPELRNKREWVGTQIVWDLRPDGESTKVVLTHVGLTQNVECYAVCETGWRTFVESLGEFLRTGQGRPYTPTK